MVKVEEKIDDKMKQVELNQKKTHPKCIYTFIQFKSMNGKDKFKGAM